MRTGGLFKSGYYVSGITSQVALQYRKVLYRCIYLTAESKINVSRARVVVSEGVADLSATGFHALFGAGIEF